ncbi:hypothetical protein CHS0354_020211 [Potamilus streckersoni]|uniref:DNA polymerase eta n=1 Tax=Potamilus streckersoni TaxID=2493646 RepID=A0AAE0VX92_9BIVA|nr:hypothetical protein CHS0354_020211 [Potamilus streckersoni]
MERVVALVDMDCFYVQVEQRLDPSLKGKPCAVVQYKTWKGGGIIAVGYEARACGVMRNMRGDDAKAKCPSIQLVRVPEVRGKADLTKYREAGAEVIEVLSKFSGCVERASIDEAYIDLTAEVEERLKSLKSWGITPDKLPNTYIVGYDKAKEDQNMAEVRSKGVSDWLEIILDNEDMNIHEIRLAVGGIIAEEMRAAVFAETGFRCSAGIAHNKMLAKLVCGLYKPNKQTILPHTAVAPLFQTLPVGKVRNLGGKLGQSLTEQLGVEFMGDLCKFTEKELQQHYGDKTGSWLYEVCRGFEHDPVQARQLPKSIGCSKTFRGKECLDTKEKVYFWLSELSKEVEERLMKDKETNKRTAKSLTVSISCPGNPSYVVASRTCALFTYSWKKFADNAFALLQKFNTSPAHQKTWSPHIIGIGLSASKFVNDAVSGMSSIEDIFLKSAAQSKSYSNNRQQISTGTTQSSSLMEMEGKTAEKKMNSSLFQNVSSFLQRSTDNRINSCDNEICNNSASSVTVCDLDEKGIKKKENRGTLFSFFKPKTEEENCVVESGSVIDVESENHNSDTDHSTFIQNDHCKTNFLHKGFFASKLQSMAEEDVSEQQKSDRNSVSVLDLMKEADMKRKVSMKPTEVISVCRTSDGNVIRNKPIENSVLVENEECPIGMDILHNSAAENYKVIDLGCKEIDSKSAIGQMSTNDDYLPCENCGELVLIWEMPEHLDFHFAMKLQNDINTPSHNILAPFVSSTPISGGKRKLSSAVSSTGSSKKVRTSEMKPTKLDMFFIKKN